MCEECGCEPLAVVSDHGHGHPDHHHDAGHHGHDHAADNLHMAEHNREHLCAHGVVAVNLVGSPGSGKTALLEATARIRVRPSFAAITADLATDLDARRLSAAGIPALGVVTGSAWHLDAGHVHHALHDLPLHDLDYLFLENAGDLIAPAVHDLGQTLNVVVLSVTEGDDKPLKFPVTFRKADLVVLTKMDLLPHLPEVRIDAIEAALARLMPHPALIPVSARSGAGMERLIAWLEAQLPRTAPERTST